MPELPEVCVQVKYLRAQCMGWRVRRVVSDGWSVWKELPQAGQANVLNDFFAGNRIEDITLRGKNILFKTSRGLFASHLMFRGRWSVRGRSGDDVKPFVTNYKHHKKPPKDSTCTFYLVGPQGRRLEFHTPEYKAHMRLYQGVYNAHEIPRLARMGPEVVITEETDGSFEEQVWTLDFFKLRTSRSRQAIKAFLLDQKRQSGLGNMYVCEALYDARINPSRPANSLSSEELETLYKAVQSVVRKAIESHLDYEEVLRVYQRKEDPLGWPVSVMRIQSRKTFWVPELQY